jgi:PAS domain S-box-containing protein
MNPSNVVEYGAFLLAQVVAIAAMRSFPAMRPRGREAVVMALDGLIIGTAAMTMASALVYSRILDATDATDGSLSSQVAVLAYPVIDVVLATVSFTVISRSRDESVVLLLVGTGFLGFAIADLAFLTSAAHDGFVFGTPIDLGWMVSYLLIGTAALHPRATLPGPADGQPSRSDVRYTVVVFAVIVAAVFVEVTFGGSGLNATTSVVWFILIAAAGARQILLTYDNAKLRVGLEQRVAEQTADLRRMARRTEVLVSSVGDGIYGVDPTGRITFVNPSAARMLGADSTGLLGRRAHQEFHAPAEDGAPHRWQDCYVTQAIKQGLVSSVEDVYVRADGGAFPVEITSGPIVDDDVITGAVVAFRDITQRREVDRIKNELLSVVSHELRTPLTAIRGSLGLLSGGAAGPLTPTAHRMATVALRSSERLTRLLNDILDVERLESGALPMRMAEHDAEALLTSAAAVLADMARAADIGIHVGRASGRVVADQDRILQTLTNLISNALKFSPPGATVELEAEQVDGEVVFRVRDTGRGIPDDRLETVFERFEQVDSSDARLEGGTGLGLAISRGIVERHGGRIWAESTLGQGTTMLFTLPAAERAQTAIGS